MYQLDPVGRLAPSSLDVSRAAARRHAHLSAVGTPAGTPQHLLSTPATRTRWARSAALAVG